MIKLLTRSNLPFVSQAKERSSSIDMDPIEAARHFKSLARRDAFSRMEQELETLLKTAPEGAKEVNGKLLSSRQRTVLTSDCKHNILNQWKER